MPDDLYPAAGPSWAWTVLGIVLVAAVVGWWSWIGLATRRPSLRRSSRAAGAVPVEELRRWALAEVDVVTAAHREGDLGDRDVAQRLSALVRRFVFEASGSPAHVRSLAELRGGPDGELTTVVAWLYPEEFAADPDGAADESIARARAYLERWRR